MNSLNLPTGVFSSDELKGINIYNHYCFWSSSSSDQSLVHQALCDAAEKHGMNTKDLKDWFRKLCKGEGGSDELFEEFKTLKSPAMSQSEVLRNIKNSFLDGQEYEIPVQIPSLVLPNTISFCNKKHKFNNIIETAVEQLMGAWNHLKGTVNDYMGWINGFLKSNKPLFSHLHQAADYLNIPALLELTSMAVGDMKESSVQDISEWYAGLSIPRMLSPLGIQAFSTLWQLDFFS